MDGEVEKAEPGEAPQEALVLADGEATEEDVIVKLRFTIGEAADARLPEIAGALMKLVLEGNVQAAKLLFEILEKLVKDRASAIIRVERSLAEEWGTEPDWADGSCIHCAALRAGGQPAETHS